MAYASMPNNGAKKFFCAFYSWQRVLSCSHSIRHHVQHNRISCPTRAIRSFSASPRRRNNNQRHELIHTSDSKELPSAIRTLMRYSPSSVVVLTTSSSSDFQPPSLDPLTQSHLSPNFRGMTMSSFTTVTLSPTPIVCFNIKLPSRTHSAITARGSFKAHFLANNRHGAFIASAFARNANGGADAFSAINKEAWEASETSIYFGHDRTMAPTILGPGVRAVADCFLLPEMVMRVGDHEILVAEISRLVVQGEVRDVCGESLGDGLMYQNHAFRRIGEKVPATKAEELASQEAAASEALDDLTNLDPQEQLLIQELRRRDFVAEENTAARDEVMRLKEINEKLLGNNVRLRKFLKEAKSRGWVQGRTQWD